MAAASEREPDVCFCGVRVFGVGGVQYDAQLMLLLWCVFIHDQEFRMHFEKFYHLCHYQRCPCSS
jgi:hypothetical protein